jgi:hypothetical protein
VTEDRRRMDVADRLADALQSGATDQAQACRSVAVVPTGRSHDIVRASLAAPPLPRAATLRRRWHRPCRTLPSTERFHALG